MAERANSPFSPGNHVIAYLRDSGHENQEASVHQQRAELENYCRENNLILSKLYIDEAQVGSDDAKRDRLAEMMYDLRRHIDVAGVIVWSSARLARNSIHGQFYRAEIRKLGYKFYSLIGRNIEGPESIIFEALEDYKNERYLADMSQEVKRGLRSLVRDHGCVPGTPPTGFTRQQITIGTHRDGKPRTANKWIPDPAMTDRIAQAFKMRATNHSLAEINRETHLFRSVNSYTTFFSNKIYIGILEFGDDLVINDYCPPLIDRATWDQVQQIQKNYTRQINVKTGSKYHPRRVASSYVLSGLIHCARCGSPLFGRTHPQKTGPANISYYCTSAYNHRDCTKHRIPGKLVEDIVLESVIKRLLQPDAIEQIRQQLITANLNKAETQKTQRAKITRELGETRRQITNLTNAIAETGHSRAMLTRLTGLEHTENDLLTELTKLETNSAEIPQIDLTKTNALIAKIQHIWPIIDPPTKRRILTGLIQRIDVDRDGRKIFGTITFFFPPTNNLGKDPPSQDMCIHPVPPRGRLTYVHIITISVIIPGKAGRYKEIT